MSESPRPERNLAPSERQHDQGVQTRDAFVTTAFRVRNLNN